jgi:hypothetical protein
MGLTLKVINDSSSSLIVAGFMRPIDQNEEAIIMVDSDGIVLGIDQRFALMLNNRFSGKQIVQEEQRLANLLPEVRLSRLEQQEFQDSYLEVDKPREGQ